jgi:hypothetical protein
MDAGDNGIDATAHLRRAGFWRRCLATLIDWVVVALPFQALTVVLFAATAGVVQMHGGILFSVCEPTKAIPEALNPPPPHDSNFARTCRISFFGAPTGATLTVGRATRDGAKTITVTQTYMLDENGEPINGKSIDEIVVVAFLAYLLGMVWKSGRTLGARIVKIRVVEVATPEKRGVPLGRAMLRYLAMSIGVLPASVIFIYQFIAKVGIADAMFTTTFFQWFIYAAALAALWIIALIFQIARKRDPIYDSLVGTAVLRD